ncbi:PAS domain-containing sensor histidine kinase [Tardiphaga sp.]|uniref:sensor histidine kinase n=1 Tax=Tardiphaga sp. TaxID=1926292 RepID=UPI00260634A7|nr:PAS domain-containing sensor histidine kinase [Tardiphaga sp.]
MNDELVAAGSELAGNDDVLRGVLAGCGDCIKILDLDGRLQFMSEGGKRIMEVDDFAKLKGCPWPDFWVGAGNIDARNAVEVAKAGGVAHFKGAANTAKGTPRYWDVQVSAILGSDDKPSHLLSISRDITDEWRAVSELNEAMDRQAFLTAELQHRIKNTLAMVGAIANQTMRGDDVDAAREAFSARLMTLSHAHDILIQTSWSDAPIKEVVNGALASHRTGQGRISVTGPDMVLQPKQALALALAVHELATNATKYGSLSGKGRVEITWSDELTEGVPGFRFKWAESGGPVVTEPPAAKRGFGSRLIERMLSNDFSAEVRVSYKPSGVECELVAPLSVLTAPALLVEVAAE